MRLNQRPKTQEPKAFEPECFFYQKSKSFWPHHQKLLDQRTQSKRLNTFGIKFLMIKRAHEIKTWENIIRPNAKVPKRFRRFDHMLEAFGPKALEHMHVD